LPEIMEERNELGAMVICRQVPVAKRRKVVGEPRVPGRLTTRLPVAYAFLGENNERRNDAKINFFRPAIGF